MLEKLTRTESLTIACATTVEQVDALRRDWLELENMAPGATLFQSWHWCALGLKQMIERNGAGRGKPEVPHVYTVQDRKSVV